MHPKFNLSHAQLTKLITAVGHKRTFLIRGEAGIGKTAIHYTLEKSGLFPKHHFVKPIDCTQLSDGSLLIPDVDRELGVSRELPNERFGVNQQTAAGATSERPVFLTFDEIGKARQFIKDMIAPIVYEHRIADYQLAPGSVVLALTNLDAEGLGDQLLPHLRDRLVEVVLRKPTASEWVTNFAIPNGLHEVVQAAAKEFPQIFESFMDYEPGGGRASKPLAQDNPYIFNPRAVQDKWVTMRSLHACSDLFDAADAIGDEQTLHAALAGTVGAAFATELISLYRFGSELPDFARIVADPAGTPVPKSPMAQVLLAYKLVTRTDSREAAASVVEYIMRMREEQRALFVMQTADTPSKVSHFITISKFTELLANSRTLINA